MKLTDQESEEWEERFSDVADLASQLCTYYYNQQYEDFECTLINMSVALEDVKFERPDTI